LNFYDKLKANIIPLADWRHIPGQEQKMYRLAAAYYHNCGVMEGATVEFGHMANGTPLPDRFGVVPKAPYKTSSGSTVMVTEPQVLEYIETVYNHTKATVRPVPRDLTMLTSRQAS